MKPAHCQACQHRHGGRAFGLCLVKDCPCLTPRRGEEPKPWALQSGRCDGCGAKDDALIPVAGADVALCPVCTGQMLWLEEDERSERAELAIEAVIAPLRVAA